MSLMEAPTGNIMETTFVRASRPVRDQGGAR